jgi:nucleoside 2-deoxyribosyltransferase
MNIYFSCSITGGRQDQLVYAAIVDHLLAQGHEVPTAHLSSVNVMAEERVIEPREVYLRDLKWVEDCGALIAEVSTPSHGVGYEIALALLLGKPVFCCYRNGRRVSKMILGNTHPNLNLREYGQIEDLIEAIGGFVEEIQAKR